MPDKDKTVKAVIQRLKGKPPATVMKHNFHAACTLCGRIESVYAEDPVRRQSYSIACPCGAMYTININIDITY